MNKAAILLIEDDEEICRLTRMYLEVEGYQVDVVNDGQQALPAIKRLAPDLIILDLMLPNISGHEICQQAREFYIHPILVLTALQDDINEVSLLKLGADDYLNKPIKPHILTARIEALLRRHRIDTSTEIKDDYFQLEKSTLTVASADSIINLTAAEFELLNLLHQHKGEAVSRSDCCHALRGIDYDSCDRSIDMRISCLRKKLGDNKRPYKTIITVRNKGYMLDVS